MQDQMRNVMGTNSPMGMWQKMTEENMKLWESMSKTMNGGKPSGETNNLFNAMHKSLDVAVQHGIFHTIIVRRTKYMREELPCTQK